MRIKRGYVFDDVLLIPKHSGIESRGAIDTSVDLGKGVKLNIPIVSANMKTVTGPQMASKISDLGGLALLHRFSENRVKDYKDSLWTRNVEANPRIGISIGIKEDEKSILDELAPMGLKAVCIDVAHGDHDNCFRMVEYVSKTFPDMLLIAGNVATGSGAVGLAEAGADVIKSGVGCGSVCSTRIEAGAGVPQLTALDDIYSALQESSQDFKIIADGGLRKAGDVVKSLCFSHCVMMGSMLAGTDESPGELVSREGRDYKVYAGSSTYRTNNVEGVAGLVLYKGSVEKIITKTMQGLQSGMSYQGVSNLADLRKDPEFVELSNSGLIESRPSDSIIR